MNALDRFVCIYQYLVFLKLLIMLSCSIALLALNASQLSIVAADSTMHNQSFIFTIGGIIASIVTLVYVLKRWISSHESLSTEWPRLFTLIWTIYGTILYANNKLPHSIEFKAILGLLWIVSLGLLFKMRFPLDENKEIRV